MQITSIHDVKPATGSVFIDNVMVCSADRLLHTRYEDLLDEKIFTGGGMASALFHHDLLNLAILVESIVCHDTIYINADFIDRWNQDIEKKSLRPLKNIIIPILWPPEDRSEADRRLRESLPDTLRLLDRGRQPIHQLEQIVFSAIHHPPSISEEMERDYLVPYKEGYQFGMPRPFDLAAGTAFYLMCSQLLGIPYKPSILRASLLSKTIKEEFSSKHFNASEAVIALLEKSREEVIEDYFNKILELNMIEVYLPCILTAILRDSTSPSDVIPIAVQMRESKEAKAYRKWCNEFSQTIQSGDLTKIGELTKEINDLVEGINKSLGMKKSDNLTVGFGWGPVRVSLPFALPRVLQRQIYLKRHLWFLHQMYSISIRMARSSDEIKRVLMTDLPEKLQIGEFHSSVWKSFQRKEFDYEH